MNRHTLLLTCLFLAGFSLLVSNTANAQNAKKMLDHEVYDIWNRINERALAPGGRWMLYTQAPEDGDAALHVKHLSESKSYLVHRGGSAKFSNDNQFVVSMIKPAKDSIRQAKRDKKKDDEMPKDSLAILNLEDGSVVRIAGVKSFKMPEEAAGWVAYHREKEEDAESDKEEAGEKEEEDKRKKAKDKKEGTPLVLRNLASGEERVFAAATGYIFSEDGNWLVYTASSKDGDADGIFAVETASGTVKTIMDGEGDYRHPVFDKESTQLAFLSNQVEYAADQPQFSLYHWDLASSTPSLLAQQGTSGIPADWWVSEHDAPSFSEKGTRLFFGSAPRPAHEAEDDESIDDEEVKLDVWHWKDPLLQPMQLVQLKRENERSYKAVVHLADNRVVQLANKNIPEVNLGMKGDADIALGVTNMPYRDMISWEFPRFNDIYTINVQTGEHRLLQQSVQSSASLSPNAQYITWWDRDALHWFAQSVTGSEPVNLSAKIPHRLDNELHDWPYKPSSYGNAGWTADDASFLIYDKHDIWAVDPVGSKAPVNVTEGVGREKNLRFRYVRTDQEETSVNPTEPMLLSALNMDTKAGGFYRDQISRSRKPEQLVMMAHRFSNPTKAKDAEVLMFTRENFQEFPDLWTSNTSLQDMTRISTANPQQSDYLWGSAELINWVSLDGIPLTGILYKPEGFDPAKKYPMMVYFYEKMSDNLHRHAPPATARSSISYSFYTSRGYLVFVPDIPYRIGYPGESALNAVVPGVTSLSEKGFVDQDNIGVQGHSWGGYQIAYMITETDIFKAAEAGAPVSNMTSAYGGIRWGTGMSRMFQYERSQSRIGGTLWEYPLRYIDNSPLFQADKIKTPLLMMHNDDDGAVPWYQGIEFFVALRRLGKPVWMLNYNGEAHGLGQYHNKRDWAIRMQQFFDHYLKGAPAPVWMEQGVPATMKGKTLGLELVEPAVAPASSDEG
ncbi:MAG: prolyl oligopeptidase family serine peptidase [Rhodothermales bacterium]